MKSWIIILTTILSIFGGRTMATPPDSMAELLKLDSTINALNESWEDHKILVIGDYHGTNEIPAIVANLILVKGRTKPVIVGLELPREDQAMVDRLLRHDQANDEDSLRKSIFWNRKSQDGRSSMAMLAILLNIRKAINNGADINVICMDGYGLADRDKAMYLRLKETMDGSPNAMVIAYAGNYHTDYKQIGDRESLGKLLHKDGAWIVNISARCGNAWVCDDNDKCKSTSLQICDPRMHKEVEIENPASQVDQIVHIYRFSASPPAVIYSEG